MDQPGKVANPARGQLNRENNIPLSPCVPENLVSRNGFSSPVPRQPAHLHTQAESGAYLRDSSRVPRRLALPGYPSLAICDGYFPVPVRACQVGLARRVPQSRPASACSSPNSGCACVCIKLHILPVQSGPVIQVILCHSCVCIY